MMTDSRTFTPTQPAPWAEVQPPTAFTDAAALAQMERMVLDLGRMYRERNEALEEVARAHHEALFRLALAAEYRDDESCAPDQR